MRWAGGAVRAAVSPSAPCHVSRQPPSIPPPCFPDHALFPMPVPPSVAGPGRHRCHSAPRGAQNLASMLAQACRAQKGLSAAPLLQQASQRGRTPLRARGCLAVLQARPPLPLLTVLARQHCQARTGRGVGAAALPAPVACASESKGDPAPTCAWAVQKGFGGMMWVGGVGACAAWEAAPNRRIPPLLDPSVVLGCSQHALAMHATCPSQVGCSPGHNPHTHTVPQASPHPSPPPQHACCRGCSALRLLVSTGCAASPHTPIDSSPLGSGSAERHSPAAWATRATTRPPWRKVTHAGTWSEPPPAARRPGTMACRSREEGPAARGRWSWVPPCPHTLLRSGQPPATWACLVCGPARLAPARCPPPPSSTQLD